MINERRIAIRNPLSGKHANPSERFETARFSNAENPTSRSHRKHTTNIQHIVGALVAAGYTSLDAQAKALGVHRATAWTIIRKKHKLDRLNTNTTNRMLRNPELPQCVRAVIEQYVAERPIWAREDGTFETSKQRASNL